MKKAIRSGDKETERGIGVVLEHIEGKIDFLIEGQQNLDEKIDRKIDELRGEMNYKFDIVFDELHDIREEPKDKVSRNELEERLSLL